MSTPTDPVITGHPHWKAFDEEESKTDQLRVRAASHVAKADESRRLWELAAAAYDAEVLNAELEGREPDSTIGHPGEYVAPKPLFAKRAPIEVILEREQQIEQMRRDWGRRIAPDLLPQLAERDSALLTDAQAALGQIAERVRELGGARESREWLAACGAPDIPAAPSLFEVNNLMRALSDALRRAGLPVERPDAGAPLTRGDGWGNVGMNLDDVAIEV